MPDRRQSRAATSRRIQLCVDVVCVSHQASSLVVLLAADGRRSWSLPTAPWRTGDDLTSAAVALTRATAGRPPSWCEQSGVVVGEVDSAGADVTVTFASVLRRDAVGPAQTGWHDVAKLPAGLPRRFAHSIAAAVAHIRRRMNQVPIAFQLLPVTFALGELQEVYELLLGRSLHKASFRRALRAAAIVEPTQKWRSDGRGRPAQLYRFAPKSRRMARRAVRFDLADD